ncbi:hypothetical protein DAPPUDRAFT_316340 [Daphnia pulex]|uniref:Uncharacterized protein n=1 Tax=Daphnia pulex TaxID=6669 RepID=E9GCK7_DAPPU|nr:hypothetical protein DAPPUDRAFT_316340 [Daphnia pulex]|eukprot:EFX82847.1 hypothetical protein DAPPUDRAFT_316340 [Daphnia pulex]
MRELTFIFRSDSNLNPSLDSPGVNCANRHKEKDPSRVIWEKDEPAGQEERVTFGLDINITTYPKECKKGPFRIVFAGCSAEALASRISNDAEAKVVIDC